MKGALLVMVAAFFWGTLGIITKLVYQSTTIGPIALAWMRLLFALPFIGAFVAAKRYPISMSRRDAALFLGFAVCGLVIFHSLYFTSYVYTTAQHAVALLYTAPAFVALLSSAILKERMTKTKLIAVALSMAGTLLILNLTSGESLFGSRTLIGDLLAIGAGLAYASWYIFGKILGKDREPAVTTLIVLSIGAVLLIPVVAVFNGFYVPKSSESWSLLLALGIIPTALAYILYLSGLKLVDATKASVFAIVEPLTGIVLAYAILHETLSSNAFLGFVLIISSILLVSFKAS